MRRKKIFGLDISDHSIEAVLLEKPFFGKPKISAYARTILIGEVVKDGIIKKPDRLKENLIKLLASAQPAPIKTSYCIVSLPDSKAFTTIFKFPAGLRRDEIQNTIPFKAEEVIPFKAEEVYFDFKTITKDESAQEVFYVAIPKKIIDSYLEVLGDIGLVPIAFDLESISLARSIVSVPTDLEADKQKVGQAVLMMDIGARTTNLNIFDRNGIRQSLTITVAGSRFTKSIAQGLNITEREAEDLKTKIGFDPQQKKGKIVLILQKELRPIVEETKKLINYYQEETGRQVSFVILAGGSSLLPKIDKYLADNLNLLVGVGDPLIKILDPKKFIKMRNKAVLFANVIGLGLRAVTKNPILGDINLLPLIKKKFEIKPEQGDKAAWRLIYIRLAVFGLLVLIFAGVLLLKNKNIDLYRIIFPPSKYETVISPDLNVEALEGLRELFLLPEATTTPTSTPAESTTTEEISQPLIELKVKIKETGLGYLNVRQGPGLGHPKIGQAVSGQEYILVSQQKDWYQIQLDEKTTGWVYSIYAEKLGE